MYVAVNLPYSCRDLNDTVQMLLLCFISQKHICNCVYCLLRINRSSFCHDTEIIFINNLNRFIFALQAHFVLGGGSCPNLHSLLG